MQADLSEENPVRSIGPTRIWARVPWPGPRMHALRRGARLSAFGRCCCADRGPVLCARGVMKKRGLPMQAQGGAAPWPWPSFRGVQLSKRGRPRRQPLSTRRNDPGAACAGVR
jgi:hypothetical protein